MNIKHEYSSLMYHLLNLSIRQDKMFNDAYRFNQDIGNWNVSQGVNFVSNILTRRELYLRWHNTWILTTEVSSNNHSLHFSLECLWMHIPSTKISVTGMFLRVMGLWVNLWPVKTLFWVDIIHENSSLMYDLIFTLYTSAFHVFQSTFLQSKYC